MGRVNPWPISRYEPVRIIGAADVLAAAREALADAASVSFVEISTSDSWVRDTGPVFLVPRQRTAGDRPRAVCWDWNAWGGKYPPWDADAGVSRGIAQHLGLPIDSPGIVLEGGAIETDGDGTILANERCVVDPKRNPDLDRSRMEAALRKHLSIDRVIWLGGELAGDDTDGHVDQIARFVAPGCVLAARQPDRLDPNHGSLDANLAILAAATDAQATSISSWATASWRCRCSAAPPTSRPCGRSRPAFPAARSSPSTARRSSGAAAASTV